MRTILYVVLLFLTLAGGINSALAKGEEAFLFLQRDFVFDTETGHKILYAVDSNNFTFFDKAGNVLASGQPFRMVTPYSREGYFEHSYTLTDLTGTQYSLAIATRLHKSVQPDGLVVPKDSKFILDGAFLLVPFDETIDILRSEITGPIAKIRSIVNQPGANCRAVFQ